MEENKKDIAISFLKLASGGKVRESFSKFVGTTFKHHNPFYEGSAAALMAGMEENARLNPHKVFEVKRTIAEGDMVVTYSHVQQKAGDLGAAVVHIFRIEDNRIVELWDLGQPLLENPINQYGMF